MTERDVLHNSVKLLVDLSFNPQFLGIMNIFYVQATEVPLSREHQEMADMLNENGFKWEYTEKSVRVMKCGVEYIGIVKGLVYDFLLDAKNNEKIKIFKKDNEYIVASPEEGLIVDESFPHMLVYLNDIDLERLAEN